MELKTIIAEKVRKYYIKGLTAKEIGKLLDLSTRTIQRYIAAGKFNELTITKTVEQKAIEMHTQGLSYAEIAKRLRVNKTTVYNWHRKAKTKITE